MNVASVTDLTLLDTQANASAIQALTEQGVESGVAALCVYPQHLAWIPKIDCSIKRATVANFPTGNDPQDRVLNTIQQAIIEHDADEIDYVFPYQHYLAGEKQTALSYCHQAYQQTKQYGKCFKVILETGALPSPDYIYELSVDIIKSGCDFLKTSTGKIAIGATPSAACAILQAIQDTKATCGIKLSGGIRTLEQAQQYMNLAQEKIGLTPNKSWFRLGMSRLL